MVKTPIPINMNRNKITPLVLVVIVGESKTL